MTNPTGLSSPVRLSVDPRENPPLTAAGVAAVVGLLLAEFTSYTTGQVAAISAVVVLVAGVVAQAGWIPKFGTRPLADPPDEVADPSVPLDYLELSEAAEALDAGFPPEGDELIDDEPETF